MTRAIKLNLDRTFETFDLGEYPHLREVLEADFDIVFLNGPIAMHPNQVTVGIAVDDMGLLKQGLEVNRLATSLRGVFFGRQYEEPLLGVAVVIASDCEGESVDVPNWAIELITAIKKCTDEAIRYHQDPRYN